MWDESDDEDADQHQSSAMEGVLHEYARQGNHKAIATLIRRGGRGTLKININEPDYKGRTPLMIGCQYGWSKVVDYLCQAGANNDLKDKEGHAAIHQCVLSAAQKTSGTVRASHCIRALYKGNVEIDRKTADGRTALHCAMQLGLPELCTTLKVRTKCIACKDSSVLS